MILRNILTRLDQVLANLLGRLHLRIQRIDRPNESNLFHALRIASNALPNLLIDAALVFLRCELDEEVSRVHGEQRGQERGVGHFARVDGVAVAAGAGVDTDVGAFGGAEAGEDFVVQVDKRFEEGGAGPRVARVVLGG